MNAIQWISLDHAIMGRALAHLSAVTVLSACMQEGISRRIINGRVKAYRSMPPSAETKAKRAATLKAQRTPGSCR